MDHLCFCVFVSCVSHAFSSVHCCLVVTCWERAVLLALVGDVYIYIIVFFLLSHVSGILVQQRHRNRGAAGARPPNNFVGGGGQNGLWPLQ